MMVILYLIIAICRAIARADAHAASYACADDDLFDSIRDAIILCLRCARYATPRLMIACILIRHIIFFKY